MIPLLEILNLYLVNNEKGQGREASKDRRVKYGCEADLLEYTGPLVLLVLASNEKEWEMKLSSSVMLRARHPFIHFYHSYSISGYTDERLSKSKKFELLFSKEVVDQIKKAAKAEIERVLRKRGEKEEGTTLLDELSLTTTNFRANFGNWECGHLIVLHFLNTGSTFDGELFDDLGVRVSSTSPLLYPFLECEHVKTLFDGNYTHIWVKEPDFRD